MSSPTVITSAPRGLLELLRPWDMGRNLWAHRHLILQLAKRDIQGRYRASYLGLLWSILTPLILLAIYTFVFGVVFSSHWGDDAHETKGFFAMTMFCGVLVFNLFAEVTNRAPTMITGNPNYVKKVVFPLELFGVSGLLSALFTFLVGFGVWLVGRTIILGLPPWTVLWLPVVLLPVCLVTLAVAWVLSSVGVFLRDISHFVLLATQVLFFLTPVFYPIVRVPHPYRRLLEMNPLSHSVEDARRVMMQGLQPDWGWWAASLAGAAAAALIGYAFFMKSKRAFADVL